MRANDFSVSVPGRRLLLVDCDAFFVQVARLEDPEGAGKADLLVVGGSATGRGVVTSASYEARKFGVHSAMPTAEALRLCPDATVVPVPREACTIRSRQVRDALSQLAPVVQAASIDEFYLDLTGTERLFSGETLEESAWRIRETVLADTQISVSIGGGTRKLIAKLATGCAKPAGVHIVSPGAEEEFMRGFELADLPGVGPAFVAELAQRGLVSVNDAVGVQEDWLRRWFGEVRGAWLYSRIRGLDSSSVESREPRKSISAERTFSEDMNTDQELDDVVFRLSASVGASLRGKTLRVRTITVKLRDHDFKTRSASRTLPNPVETDGAILGVARELLAALRAKRRTPARLLGVGLSGLIDPAAESQLALFEDGEAHEDERSRALTRTVDQLNERFGDSAVLPGRLIRPER